jgi:molybdopterin-guanine dinucleotide biosynthesis protein A
MSDIAPAAILAGGRSLRMGGGDKCMLMLGGTTILAHVIANLRSQTGTILLNSNSDASLFSKMGLTVRADALPGRLGPLVGILTAMLWAQEIGATSVLTVPADTPFLPPDLMARLVTAGAGSHIAIAVYGEDVHPTIGLWPVALASQLHRDLTAGMRRVRTRLDQMSFKIAAFEQGERDPFWNINTPEDWEQVCQITANSQATFVLPRKFQNAG